MRPRLPVHAGVFLLIAALVCVFSPAGMRAQAAQPYEFHSREEMNNLVAPIALYPDALLYQIMSAATFPDQVPEAAEWAQQHGYLSGAPLAHAILEDHVSWDDSVQALLPFPVVLQMMSRNMGWTTDLGEALLDQREDMMDALQTMRHRAENNGFLHSNSMVDVYGRQYIQIMLVNRTFVVVPRYSPAIVFAPPRPGFGPLQQMGVQGVVRIGAEFAPWGWGVSQIHWSQHEMTIHRSAPEYERESRMEKHTLLPSTDLD
jgi:hypothetical protein